MQANRGPLCLGRILCTRDMRIDQGRWAALHGLLDRIGRVSRAFH